MTLTDSDRDSIERLEETLWREATRFDRAHMERVLALGFFEFGQSGRRYTRDETLDAQAQAIDARFPLREFAVVEIDERTVLVTYVSEVGPLPVRARRSSLWTRAETGWRLRFHQGTPLG
jgi:hypothetical protein